MLELSKRYTIKEIADEVGLEKSAVRFYLQNVLPDYLAKHFSEIEPKERKATLYPQEILERVKFIKKVKTELKQSSKNKLKPSIQELRGWMNNISDQQVRDVIEGREPLAFGVPVSNQRTRQNETLGGERLPEDSDKYGAQISAHYSVKTKSSAAEYTNALMHEKNKPVTTKRIRKQKSTLKLGPNLSIHYPVDVTPNQEKQIMMIGELLQSIVSKED